MGAPAKCNLQKRAESDPGDYSGSSGFSSGHVDLDNSTKLQMETQPEK